VLNYSKARLASRLAEILLNGRFDTVQIEGVLLSSYLPVIQSTPNRPAILVDWHNTDSEVMWQFSRNTSSWAKRMVARRTAFLLERVETQLLERFGAHTVASESERKKVLARCAAATVHVIPNGVDVRHFSPAGNGTRPLRTGPSGTGHDLLFVGSMDYHANIDAVTWFSRNVWPEIARTHPDMRFTIVGRNPAPEVCSLSSDRVRVTGTVDDVRPYYASAVAVIAPIRSGSGTRLKILEAMAAGVPVVSTRLGAEGISVEDDVHLLLADSGQEIVAAIRRIISSSETRLRLVRAARGLIATRYDWSTIGEKLFRIHYDLVQAQQQPAFAVSS